MPSPMVRRGIWAIGAAALIACLIVLALPSIASTRIVRDRIALEMSSWSGYQVTIGAPPAIEVWPTFRAILTNVRLSESDAPAEPVVSAERVEIELSALAALRGDVVFSIARFIRPTLRVERLANGAYMPALPGGGRIAASIDAIRENPDNSDDPPSDPFGTVEFSDGRIALHADGKTDEIVTGIAGQVNWPALDKAGTLSATALWRDEPVTFNVASAKPLSLFAGAAAPTTATIGATSASASFGGVLKLSDNAYFDGEAKFSAPSVQRLVEWWDPRLSPASPLGSVSFTSRIVGDSSRVKFDSVALALNENRGMGALNLEFGQNLPMLSGSLAFDEIDLESLLAALTPLALPAGSDPEEIGAGLSSRVNIDLRLSAANATAGSVELADVAATAQVKDGLTVLDVSDATAFGGTVQAGVRFDRKPDGMHAEMRLLASNIDGGALGAAAGMTRLVPIGQGAVSIILKGPGASWETILKTAHGSISASFGPGALSGFDLAGFLKRTGDDGFFALDEVSRGTLPIKGAELKASVANGVVRIEKAEAKAASHTLWIQGIVPYVGRGLALSGGIVPTVQQAAQTGDAAGTAFFVGGSWSAPFISSVVPAPPTR